MESQRILSSPSNGDDTETDSVEAPDLPDAGNSGAIVGVQYRLKGGTRALAAEQDHLRKGLNRISSDSASTYEMVDAGSPQSPAASDTSDGHGMDGDDDDDGEDEEDDEMWSNIVRINNATVATVAELAAGGSEPAMEDGGTVANEIEYEVQEGSGPECDALEREAPDGSVSGGGAAELLQRKRFDLTRSSTKEEKQRHNEEIVIMKSNSLSSDTTPAANSWEPVSVDGCCIASGSDVIVPEVPELAELEGNDRQQGEQLAPIPSFGGPSKPCFIDASSLFDDDEVVYPSFQESAPSQQLNWCKPSEATAVGGNSSSIQLATILCDDEKLRANVMEKTIKPVEVKDQFAAGPSNDYLASKLKLAEPNPHQLPETVSGNDNDHDREEVLARQEAERKQGTFLFQNSIQQYSGHLLDVSLQFAPEETYSDLSLPSVYSSSSEPNYGEYSSLTISDNHRYSLGGCSSVAVTDERASGRMDSLRGGTSTSGYNSSSADYNSRTQATSDVESTSHYPNTPFNSIVHVTSAASIPQHMAPNRLVQELSEDTGNETSRASSVDRESHSTPIRIPKRMQKHDESAPIVSGGASIEDFTPKQCESPSVRRRTDTCPIVSGGSISFDEPAEERTTARQLSKSGSGKSWVVDLKNCPDDEKTAAVAAASSMHSLENSGQRSLGFFVDLGSLKTPEEEKSVTVVNSRPRTARTELMKKSTGFYIDLSDDGSESTRSATPKLGSTKIETPPPSASALTGSSRGESEEKQTDRKNMFSMFIDFGSDSAGASSGSTNGKPAMPRKLSMPQPLLQGATNGKESVRPSSLGPAVGEESSSKPYYMFIGSADAQPSVMRRQNGSTAANGGSAARQESKRHSWNTTVGEGAGLSGGFHERRIASNSAYQRSTSVTSDRGIMNILDKIPLLSKTSSMSIDSSVSPFEDFTCSKSELSTYSNHSVSSNSAHSSNESKISPKDAVLEGQPMEMLADGAMVSSAKKKRKDAKINETFDKSSQGSITDGILSSNEDASPTSTTTDTDDVTFQNNPAEEEALLILQQPMVIAAANEGFQPIDEPIKLSTITTNTVSSSSSTKLMETIVETVECSPRHTARNKPQHTMETLHATIEKQKQLLETVSENVESHASTMTSSSFVKLSDMDKPPTAVSQVATTKFELHSSNAGGVGGGGSGSGSNMSNSAGSSRVARLFECQKYNTIGSAIGASSQAMRQQQQQQKASNYYHSNGGVTSMERHSWNMSRSTGNNFVSLISSSVENSRSLSRLFPHLSKAFSSSLPSDVGMNGTGRNGQDGSEMMHSDFSCTSSITSSRSGIESIDESISSRQPRRLGEDLLKMFLQEIATDVTIEVETKKMRAHKCILRSRCQYFAAILAGSWVQNAGNVITLPGYSYAAVHFALCHIYSGASHPPEGISLMELAALSDLLGLEGLKEVTAYALKTNYCHNFHKPCVGCTDGVLQVLPVTLNHGLDDLYRKCLKWVCRHYVKIWSQKQFSQLPLDVVHRCKQQVVAHLNSESVLTTILDSEQLLTLLHPYKWSVEVENVVRDILETAYDYIADHFASLLASDSFLSLGQNYRWAIPHLEPILLPAANNLSPDQACKSYPRATRLQKLLQAKVLTMTTTTTSTPMSSSDNTNVVNIYEKQTKASERGSGGSRKEVDYNLQEEEMDWCDEFVGMVNAILSAVEQCLIRQCARAMRVNSWQRMDVELRNKIQKLACLMETTDERKSRSRYSYSSQTSSSSSVHSRSNDMRQVRLAIQAHTKRALENGQAHHGQPLNNRTQQTQTINTHQNELNAALLNSHKLAKHYATHEAAMATAPVVERERSKQTNLTAENGRISKTASKSHVPDTGKKSSISHTSNGRQAANGIRMGVLSKASSGLAQPVSHKRSQSEDHANLKPATAPIKSEPMNNLRTKLSNVKPRYLEPKKPKNAANLHAQNNISSSGSSTRTSSPAMSHRKTAPKLQQQNHPGHESNLSLDSLSSPAKLKNANVANTKPARATVCEMDVSIDSLAESMKSHSIKTSNTLSHESLIYQEYFKPKVINSIDHQQPQQLQPPAKNGLVKDKDHHREKRPSSGKSLVGARPLPGGIKTNHSSSSIPSAVSVRTNGINRTASSASVGSNGGSGLVKRSFLSQRSREILARRTHEPKSNSTNSSNKSAASSPSMLLTRDKSTGSDITKSGSSASLTTPNTGGRKVFNTTLHLRRTAKLPDGTVQAPAPASKERKMEKHSSKGGAAHRTKGPSSTTGDGRFSLKGGSTLENNCTVPPEVGDALAHVPMIVERVESKLERSNTFSIDVSDNPLVLQMLE
uniref:BTB domain-containing protein n=1 Tax=Anopheles christyi TaxID=43041 RepID=A0A182JR43_9DIPT